MQQLTQTQCRNGEIIQFCSTIAATPDFSNSYKQIYTFKDGKPIQIAFFNQADTAKMQEIIGSRFFNPQLDYYITKNSFYANKRNNGYIFSFDNIVIDCDWHNQFDEQAVDHQISALLYFLDNDYAGIFPECNAVRTGRGVQLWIGLESFSSKLPWLYGLLCRYFCDRLQEIIDENGLELQVDRTASTNASGLVRLPYTSNHHRKDYTTEVEYRTDVRYSTQELMQVFPIDLNRKNQKIQPKQAKNAEYTPLNQKRMKIIEKMIADKNGDCCGTRDVILFLWYNAAVQLMDRQTATDKLHKLNKAFTEPLRESEVEFIIKYIDSKDYLRFKTSTFYDWLGISQKDRLQYDSTSSREMERQTARDKKQLRNEKILSLRANGLTIREIAEEIGCSKNTVSAVLSKNPLPDVQAKNVAANPLPDGESSYIKKYTKAFFGTSFSTA